METNAQQLINIFAPQDKKYVKLKNNETILVVEGNQFSGQTANMAIQSIKSLFGKNAKIIYVSISADYKNKDTIEGIVFKAHGILTNESRSLSEKNAKKLGVRQKLTLFPWENIDEELAEVKK